MNPLFSSFSPFQSLFIGLVFIAFLMLALVFYLTGNNNFINVDRLKDLWKSDKR